MRLSARVTGDFQAILKAETLAAERAVTAAIREATDGLKAELRAQITGAGLGERLARTWRAEVYPKGEPSLGAAGFLWSKAPQIVRAYEEGAVIRSTKGLYLAIPTPAAGRGDGGKKITPERFERRTGLRLRFVYRRRGPSLLVVDNAKLNKGGRAVANAGRRQGAAYSRLAGRATVVAFILVPRVTVKKRLDVAGAAANWRGKLPRLVVRHLENEPQ